MPQSMQITAATIDPALLDLPWESLLESWPPEVLVALPRGLSRHKTKTVTFHITKQDLSFFNPATIKP